MARHQDDLFGGAPQPLHRLFFAFRPSPSEREQVTGVAERLHASHPRTRWVSPDRYHVTLHYLGESSGPREDWGLRAREAAEGFAATPFLLELDHLIALGNPRRPALTVAASSASAALTDFWRGLQERLIRAGFKDHVGRNFLPHLTLGYSEPAPATPAVAPIVLAPAGFELIQSVEGQPDYQCLGHWPIVQR